MELLNLKVFLIIGILGVAHCYSDGRLVFPRLDMHPENRPAVTGPTQATTARPTTGTGQDHALYKREARMLELQPNGGSSQGLDFKPTF